MECNVSGIMDDKTKQAEVLRTAIDEADDSD